MEVPRSSDIKRAQPKIALIHPQLKEGGGSEARPLWCAEALKNDYDVTLITMGTLELERFNVSYGTDLKKSEIKTVEIPVPFLFKKRFDALRSFPLSRYVKKHSSEYDLLISTYNVMDFGRKGIQFIADFSFDDSLRRSFHPKQKDLKSFFYKKSLLRRMYLGTAEKLSGSTKRGWMTNLTIANSRWSRDILNETYGIEADVVYPPVVGKFPEIPWEKRSNGFVCLGRLVPEKGIAKIIEILREVRRRGHNIHLHVIGKSGDAKYIKRLKELCDKSANWCFLEGALFGVKKQEFIARHKFGINGRKHEPFGMAVAEMVKAGCMVWVPNGGGQTEIVNHPELIYEDIEDAVIKIESVLKSASKQNELRKHLLNESKRFSTEKFMIEVRNTVEKFFIENPRTQI